MRACEQCGAATAAVDLTTIRDGRVTDEALCLVCAEARGVDLRPAEGRLPSLDDLLRRAQGGPAPADHPPDSPDERPPSAAS